MPTQTETSPISLNGNQQERYLINVVPEQQDAKSVELAPCLISLELSSSTFKPEYGGNFENTKLFDAVLPGGSMGSPDCIWLFRGEDCYKFNLQDKKFESGATQMKDAFGQGSFPTLFSSGIDAAVWGGPSFPDIIYFFKGNLYARFIISQNTFDIAPQTMTSGWGSAHGTWLAESQGVALHSIETRFQGKLHFFKGPEYIRHNLFDGNRVEGPVPLTNLWSLPEPFAQGFDLAFYGIGNESQKVYVIKADEYLVFDIKTQKVTSPPKSITSKFTAFAQFIRKPQLFLVETYCLTNYYGDLMPELSFNGPQIGPGTEETFTVRIKRTTVTDITQTKTILESQDQKIVNNLNESIQSNSSSSSDAEQYDWKINSSFKGEIGWGITSADGNAQFNANGGSNNVRQQFTEAAAKGIDKQVNNTYENHKQSISSVNSSYQAMDEFESVWTRVVKNPTDKVIRLGYVQLAQEYISLVVLKNIMLAFSNGEEVDIAPLTKMDSFLSKYLSDSSHKAKAQEWILTELGMVNDYKNNPRTVIKAIGENTFQFDPDLTSQLSIKKTDGTIKREIVVDGLIVGQHRFKQLTDLVVMTEIGIG